MADFNCTIIIGITSYPKFLIPLTECFTSIRGRAIFFLDERVRLVEEMVTKVVYDVRFIKQSIAKIVGECYIHNT
jgi:hypothetical protein